MAQWVHCPQCDQHYQFPDTAAGKRAACPKCGKLLAVSAPAPPPVPSIPAIDIPAARPAPKAREELPWAVPVRRRRPEPEAEEAPPRPEPPPEPPPGPAFVGVPNTYRHDACGGDTTISADYVAWMTGDPFSLIVSSKCAKCRRYVGLRGLVWNDTGENVGAYRRRLRRQMHPLLIALRLAGGPLLGALLGAAVGALANMKNWDLGVLAGVLIGLPLGYFVTGMAYQIGWTIGRKKE